MAERPYATLRPEHLRVIRDDRADTPQAANNMLKSIKALYAYAVRYGLAETNPALGVEFLASRNPDGYHTWSREEVAQFEARWPIGTKQRLALALLLYTGRRRGDVVQLGRQHVRDGWIVMREQKRGKGQAAKVVEIPLIGALQRIIDASPTGELAFLVTAFGKPYTANGFGNWFREACSEAGLPHCSAHGLRKAMMTFLAEQGATAQMVQAMGGWTSLAEPTRYTRAVDRRRLAGEAGAMIQAAFSQTKKDSSRTEEKSLSSQIVSERMVTPTGLEPVSSA